MLLGSGRDDDAGVEDRCVRRGRLGGGSAREEGVGRHTRAAAAARRTSISWRRPFVVTRRETKRMEANPVSSRPRPRDRDIDRARPVCPASPSRRLLFVHAPPWHNPDPDPKPWLGCLGGPPAVCTNDPRLDADPCASPSSPTAPPCMHRLCTGASVLTETAGRGPNALLLTGTTAAGRLNPPPLLSPSPLDQSDQAGVVSLSPKIDGGAPPDCGGGVCFRLMERVLFVCLRNGFERAVGSRPPFQMECCF